MPVRSTREIEGLMNPSRFPTRGEPGLLRRTFLQTGVAALALGGTSVLGRPEGAGADTPQGDSGAEWRNRQSEMAYRRLGRVRPVKCIWMAA